MNQAGFHSALKAYSESYLQSFERPVDYICKTELPRTLIGKVDYRALEKDAACSIEKETVS